MMARGWDLSPSEIWGMTVHELVLEFETRRPHAPTDYAGGMTEGDIEAIKAEAAKARAAREAKRNGTKAA